MPTTISIQERIIRRIVTVASGVTGVVAVRTWDARDTTPFASGEVVVSWDEAVSEIKFPGNPGRARVQLPVKLTFFLYESDGAANEADITLVEWSELTKLAFILDPYLVSSGVQLAVVCLPRSGKTPEFVTAGSPTATVQLDVTFDHDADSVYACGNAITALVE